MNLWIRSTFGKIKVILGPADEPCDALYTRLGTFIQSPQNTVQIQCLCSTRYVYIYIHMVYTCPTHLVWMYDILSIYCKRTVYVHLDTKTLQNEFALYHWGFPHPIHFHHQKLYIELKVDSGPAQIFCMTWFIPRHPFTPLEDVFGATKHT